MCAADLGISASYLYQILKKERRPSLELALKIEKYTQGEVSATELIGVEKVDLDHSHSMNQQTLEEMVEKKLEAIRERLHSMDKRLKEIEKS